MVKQAITLTLPVPPSANRWWRNYRGRMVKSKLARDYQALVHVLAAAKLIKDLRRDPNKTSTAWPLFPAEPVRLTMRWYRDAKRGDLDKRVGVLLDALQGILYRNDAQIVVLYAERHEDEADPRVVVSVEAA